MFPRNNSLKKYVLHFADHLAKVGLVLLGFSSLLYRPFWNTDNFKFKNPELYFPRGSEKHGTETQTKLIISSAQSILLQLCVISGFYEKYEIEKKSHHTMLRHRTYINVWKYRDIIHMNIFLYNSLFYTDFFKAGFFPQTKLVYFLTLQHKKHKLHKSRNQLKAEYVILNNAMWQ